MKNRRVLFSVLIFSLFTSCSGNRNAADARKFLVSANKELKELWTETNIVGWINNTYITDDTDWLQSRVSEKEMATLRRLVEESKPFEGMKLDEESARQLKLLKFALDAPAPSEAEERRELSEIKTDLNSTYGKGKYCPREGECLDINAITKIMAESRDPAKLLEVWKGWHTIAPPMREKYKRFVELANKGVAEIGFKDVGEFWRSRYDMSPEEFEAEEERLWQQVKPLYDSLHCYVRKRLSEKYGESQVPRNGPIPAHLLGNIWAQDWSNIYDLLEPYPGEASLDITPNLQAQKYDASRMMKTGENFFTSLGLPALPETFWKFSMFTKPKDREVVCHASAWHIDLEKDVRIKMCTEINEEDLFTIHHELGHLYYDLHYAPLSPIFQGGANDGFHEAIGDTIYLSITPGYLKKIGLLREVPQNEKYEINVLMKRALDKIAFLPFGKLVDQWRWEVFDGRIKPEEYNSGWWRLRTQYQGIAPAVQRTEADFDPGAKYHIPGNTPYARYFIAHILQFQFHRALCKAAGYTGPLHQCSIYNSKAAGEKFATMLKMGQSKPWPEALEAVTGEKEMDGGALVEYFAPLKKFLDEANQGQQCGW